MLGLLINKGEYMDKYTKFILTVIAIGLIGNLFQGEIMTSAEAKIYHF